MRCYRNRDGGTAYNKACVWRVHTEVVTRLHDGRPYNRDNGRMSEIKPVNNMPGINKT